MTFPLAFAATVLSLFMPGTKPKSQKSHPSTLSFQPTKTPNPIPLFIIGMATGAGLYACIYSQIKIRRIRERARASYFSWIHSQQLQFLESTDEEKDEEQQENVQQMNDVNKIHDILIPILATNIPTILLSKEDELKNATIRVLSSPQNALTSNLYVGMITLPSGSKMTPKEARGLEIYYVIKGHGVFMHKTEEDGIPLGPGDTFKVNPWSMRWFENKTHDEFIFLRISDDGEEYTKDSIYEEVIKCNIDSSMTRILVHSIKQVGNKLAGLSSSKINEE